MQNRLKQIIHAVLHAVTDVSVQGQILWISNLRGRRLLFQRNIVMVTTGPSDKAGRLLPEQEPRTGKTDHSSRRWKTSADVINHWCSLCSQLALVKRSSTLTQVLNGSTFFFVNSTFSHARSAWRREKRINPQNWSKDQNNLMAAWKHMPGHILYQWETSEHERIYDLATEKSRYQRSGVMRHTPTAMWKLLELQKRLQPPSLPTEGTPSDQTFNYSTPWVQLWWTFF